MKRMHTVCVSLLVLAATAGCSALQMGMEPGGLLVPAEEPVPSVPNEARYADFWSRRHDAPDEVILDSEEIAAFNDSIPEKELYAIEVTDIPAEIVGDGTRFEISANARYLLRGTMYVTGDIPLEQAERERIVARMDTTAVPDVIAVRYGMMLRRATGKSWPSPIPLMSDPGDVEFDTGVVSTLEMGEPVALLHTSADGTWSFVQTYGFTCWIPSDAVAFGPKETVERLADDTNPVVALGHRVPVYASPDNPAALGHLSMGSTLPVSAAGTGYFEVLCPGRDRTGALAAHRGYVRRGTDVSLGFIPYTARNVYRQGFLLFGRRYGWGGMYGERDCSSYIRDLFGCFGFRLPRNSSKLIGASRAALDLSGYDRETRLSVINASPPAITVLGYPGHVMLYLGSIDGTPYVINAIWGWRVPSDTGGDDTVRRLARVTVNDIFLGEGSNSGALIDKLTTIAIYADYRFSGD